jgi:hypothetical protein
MTNSHAAVHVSDSAPAASGCFSQSNGICSMIFILSAQCKDFFEEFRETGKLGQVFAKVGAARRPGLVQPRLRDA